MKLTKSELKQIIKEELEKIQEGPHWVDLEGRSTADGKSRAVELYELTNLAMDAKAAGKTRMDTELKNGLTVTAIWKGDPGYVEGNVPHGGGFRMVKPCQPFTWASIPDVQWVITRAGSQMELPLETPPEEREVSPSMFSRIKGALGVGGKEKERVAELFQKLIKEELIEALKKK